MAKIITLFNHKGGVSKTTTIYHLSWMLTELGFKVLMIDADSQCNLTLASLGEDQFEQHYIDHPKDNIKDALAPVFESRPEILKPVKCVEVNGNNNLFLLPGNYEITKFELQLSVSISFNISFSTMMNLPGSFYEIIKKTSDNLNVDFVFIDLNPGLSSLNQTLLFSSDYFIIPCNPDYFSEQAVKSLAEVLPNWATWAGRAKDYFKDSTYPFPNIQTKFLGYTINNFTQRNRKPTKPFQTIISSIDETINNELIKGIQGKDMLIDDRHDIPYKLAELSNFQSLQAKYQEYRMPVFALSNEQIGTIGNVLNTQTANRDTFYTAYKNLSEEILLLTGTNIPNGD